MKNIMKKINKSSVGEDYFKLLKSLPFTPSFKNVNLIIYRFMKSQAQEKTKIYIAKIFKNIKN